MKESQDVVGALLNFYERLTAGDIDAFDDVISASSATSIVGTAPGEFVTERDRLRFGFETEGIGLSPGTSPKGFSAADAGYAFDEPLFMSPDGSSVRIRLTTVWLLEGGSWKLVHGHFSLGVPDEEATELQKRWGVT